MSENSITITLLNMWSLKKHFLGIISDKHVLEIDALCLVETQLLITENATSTESGLWSYFTSSLIIIR